RGATGSTCSATKSDSGRSTSASPAQPEASKHGHVSQDRGTWPTTEGTGRMKKLRLISLRLRHFKGIESFDLNIDGGNVVVYGRNSAGKSTLADGYNWLLFGKDSRDSSTFQVKTIIGGEPMHHAEHSVEGVFDVDG